MLPYSRCGLVTVVGVVFSVALLAWAAPFMPRRIHVSDEVLSLARVEKVKLVITPFPETVTRAGITPAGVRRDWEKKLRESGLVLVDTKDAMRIHLVMFVSQDESVPDGIGYCTFVMLEQPVRIERLGKDLFIPTWTGLSNGLRSTQTLASGLNKNLEDLLGKYLARSRLANEHQ